MKEFIKKFTAIFLSVLMAVCAVSMPVSAYEIKPETKTEKNYVEGEVIAVLKDSAPKTFLSAKKTSANFGKGLKMNNSYTFSNKKGKVRAVVLKSDNRTTEAIIKDLKKNDSVKYAFPNYIKKASDITNDTYSKYQWALDNTGINGGVAGLDTNPDSIWESAAASEKEQVVAIVDTGIDFEHEDLKDVLWENPYGAKLVGKHGYDFSETIKDGSPLDDNGHGTHVAGIIAAQADNEKGISGINKTKTKIMACKFLDEDGYGDTEAALSAYEYIARAIDLGTNVVAINNSWGGIGDVAEQMLFDEIFDSLGEKGAITVAAAGNESLDLSNISEDEEMSFWYEDEDVLVTPASSSSKYCLTVAATNEKDELADFSNYSKEYVDIAAPGCNILSSVPYNCFNPSIYSPQQQSELVGDIQNFNGSLTESDFGYPKFFMLAKEGEEMYEYLGTDKEITQVDGGFGEGGKALQILLKDVIDEEEDEEDAARMYAFEMPYTLEDETKAYSISFMFRANNDLFGYIGDFPAGFDVAKNLGTAEFEDYLNGGTLGNNWDHCLYNINPSEKGYPKKYKSKERKLVFIFESFKADTFVNIDDLAVSNQSASVDDFGKYDFYNGTSMATPYVSGAVALVKNAYPDSDAAEIANIIKNTGRVSPYLAGKTENGKVLSLDNTDKAPAMITSAKYNEAGDVEVKGSFKNNTKFKINGKDVTPKTSASGKATFADNSYSTRKTTIEAVNDFGSDSISLLLSNKPSPKKSAKVIGAPMMAYGDGFYMPMGVKTLPAGSKSYFVSEWGEVGDIEYDEIDEGYIYNDFLPQIDIMSIFKDSNNVSIKDAVYLGGKIYFTAVNEITSFYTNIVLGYESAFGYLDLISGKTAVLCEVPNADAIGDSLALYNGEIYIIGGYDKEKGAFSKDVYKYNSSKKAFAKTAFSLPEGRAFTSFLQYENKLIGIWGAAENGELPKVITFDGKAFKNSAANISSDDFTDLVFENGNEINIYYGNAGYSSGGLYCNGAYIYGLGDTYLYNVSTDKFTASKYSFGNEIGSNKLLATTLPGAFIGFPIESEETDPFGSVDGGIDTDEDEDEAFAYYYKLNNNYAKLDDSALEHAYLSGEYDEYYSFGDKISFKLSPEKGYVIKSISANGIKLSDESTKASVVINKSTVSITAKTKKVAPNKVTGVKVKASSKKYTVSWKKPSRAQGYEVQTYKSGKWKTVKTVKSGSTLKCTVTKSKAGKKFRVRAYAKYNSKTYYGDWSSTVKSK